MTYIFSVIATAVLFLLLILLRASRPNTSKKVTTVTLFVAAIFGLFIYTYGYLAITGNFVLAVLKAVLGVCAAFVGGNEFAAISSVAVMQTDWMQILFTLFRICALYTTASAVISSLGAEALKRLRLWATRRSRLHLIYGVTDDTAAFGNDLLAGKKGAVVYVSSATPASAAAAIDRAGCILRSDAHALTPDKKFLRSLGLGTGRELTLYALSKNASDNIRYARAMLAALKDRQVSPEQLRLVILSPEKYSVSQLQTSADRYGYGSVTAVNEPSMTARLLTLKSPPCNTLTFDADGKATADFEALIIGFGQLGQAVLKALTMNGQFEGSQFRATVFAPDRQRTDGIISSQSPGLFDHYPITFSENDARSRQMYTYLSQRGDKLKYVAVCTGSEKMNREIADGLMAFFDAMNMDLPVHLCSHSGVEICRQDGTASGYRIYTADLLEGNGLDDMAMLLNHRYQNAPEKTPGETWLQCDYFSRQSCRASADFIPAMLRAAGKTREEAAENWDLTAAQLENLSRTEHLRWCAFHYCMGFVPMTEEEFNNRARTYREQLAAGEPTLRLGKNMAAKTHACLVSWEELESLSEKEQAVTGKFTDYKAMDTDNVLSIARTMSDDNALRTGVRT